MRPQLQRGPGPGAHRQDRRRHGGRQGRQGAGRGSRRRHQPHRGHPDRRAGAGGRGGLPGHPPGGRADRHVEPQRRPSADRRHRRVPVRAGERRYHGRLRRAGPAGGPARRRRTGHPGLSVRSGGGEPPAGQPGGRPGRGVRGIGRQAPGPRLEARFRPGDLQRPRRCHRDRRPGVPDRLQHQLQHPRRRAGQRHRAGDPRERPGEEGRQGRRRQGCAGRKSLGSRQVQGRQGDRLVHRAVRLRPAVHQFQQLQDLACARGVRGGVPPGRDARPAGDRQRAGGADPETGAAGRGRFLPDPPGQAGRRAG